MNNFAFIIAGFVGIFISGGITLRYFLFQKKRFKGLKNIKYIYKLNINTSKKFKSKKRKNFRN